MSAARKHTSPIRSALARLRHPQLGWVPYAWLMYLPPFWIGALTAPRSPWYWAAMVVGTIVFLVSYFRGYWVRGPALAGVILVQTALGAGFLSTNPGASVLFVYAASFAAQFSTTRMAVRALGLVITAAAFAGVLAGATSWYWFVTFLVAPLIGGVNLHFAQMGRATRTLRLAHDEIERLATLSERERIARDMHDVLGHTLSLITIKSELASKLAERDPARAAREMRDVEQVARKALSDVRDAIRGYRARIEDELLRARALLDAASIESTVNVGAGLNATTEGLGVSAHETLAMALRESVTNVVRHASARHVAIQVAAGDGGIALTIEDDGRGARDATEGAGLRGMRERVEALGGRVDRRGPSRWGRGAALSVWLPLVPDVSLPRLPGMLESAAPEPVERT